MSAPAEPRPTELCPHCGTPAGEAFCGECGGRTAAKVPRTLGPTVVPVRTAAERTRLLLLGVGIAVIAVVVAIAALLTQLLPEQQVVLGGDGAPTPGPAPASPTTGAAPVPVEASASCVAPNSQDKRGQPTSYEAARALDGDTTTAWRCQGDGVGQRLAVRLREPARLTGVGLIPGLAKTDPTDSTDRYAQNNRISAVRLTVDSGATYDFALDTSPSNRSVQYLQLAEPVVTGEVTVTVLSSVPGSPQNGQPAVSRRSAAWPYPSCSCTDAGGQACAREGVAFITRAMVPVNYVNHPDCAPCARTRSTRCWCSSLLASTWLSTL